MAALRTARPAPWMIGLSVALVLALPRTGLCRADPAVPPHGRPLSFTMTGPPTAVYTTESAPLSTPAVRGIEKAFPGLTVSRELTRAAAAFARAMNRTAEVSPPVAFVEFLIHWAGCPDPSATATVLFTTENGAGEVVQAVGRLLRQRGMTGVTHIGVARVPAQNPPYRWRWGIVASRRMVRLRSFPTHGRRGASLPLQFRLLGKLQRPRVILLRPDGTTRELRVGSAGGWAITTVPLGAKAGTLWVEIVGDGPEGPKVAANFPVTVGALPPRTWSGFAPPDERRIRTAGQADALMLGLVNADRRRFGLRAVAGDPRLAEIARNHSRDMLAHGYFGHISPTAGGLAARLEAAGYAMTWSGENVSQADSIVEADEALMRSAGHRANIVAVKATHVGIGIVKAANGGRPKWTITEIFARPVAEESPLAFAARVRRRIRALRTGAGLAPLTPDSGLDEIARKAAGRAALRRLTADQIAPEVNALMAAREIAFRHVDVLTYRVARAAEMKLPVALTRPGVAAVGIGARRIPKSPLTVVVLLVSLSKP